MVYFYHIQYFNASLAIPVERNRISYLIPFDGIHKSPRKYIYVPDDGFIVCYTARAQNRGHQTYVVSTL